jgi:hypothetical protein
VISPDGLQWRKAAASTAQGNCVELAALPDGVAMRDSKAPDGPVLRLSRAGLAALLESARAGELDDLV